MKKFLAFLLIFTMIFAVPVFGQLSRQEVSGVLLEVMEGVNSQAGFNFANFVERAGLTHDDVVQIIMVEMADDMELLMQHYGDDWLVYAIHDFIIYFMEELEWEGTAAAVELLTSYHRNASGWTPTDDISPEDVSKALTDIAERLRVEEGFDFAEILEEAGLTHDDVVNIFWMILTIPGEGEWFVDQYGDDWLEYALLYFLEESQGEAEQGMDAAVRHLLFAHVIYGIMDVLGHENAEDFLSSPLLFSFADEDEDALISALADEHFFITFERLVSQYGVDGFMEIFDVDPLEAFIAYIMGEHVPAVVYLDEMLGGLVAETLESYAEYFEVIMSLDDILEAGSDIVIDADLNFDYELYEELFMFHDTILAYEETVITADELEQLFYFETSEEFAHYIEIYDFRHGLNIFYQNRSDYDVTIVYFYLDIANDIIREEIEIPAGRRVAVQRNFEHLPHGEYALIALFILSPDGTPDGIFAFRPTAYELGHPSHGTAPAPSAE